MIKERVIYFSLQKLVIVIFLSGISLYGFSQSKYVKKYRALTDSLCSEYGIPSAVILGVAIIESSQGKSRNCKLLNNHFGIIGKNNAWRTKKIKTRYKQYPDSRASYIDFCNLLAKKRFYKKLKGNMNYMLWLSAISKSGYSEIPVIWKQTIAAAIKKNKLS